MTLYTRARQFALVSLFAVGTAGWTAPALAAKCLYVSSYHQGYAWNDGIEEGLNKTLKGKCAVDTFYMDTNRDTRPEHAREMGIKAKEYIDQTKPDIVIACDDNASKFLVQPFFKDAALPIVFCGINWSVEPYGYPYRNATGMVEISPIKPLMNEVLHVLKSAKSAVYLAPDVISQRKEVELNKETYAKQSITVTPIFVKTQEEWDTAYKKAQTGSADFVILGNNGGVAGWDDKHAADTALREARKLTVTNYDWMAPFAMFVMAKLPEEQGEWAGLTALQILKGTSPTRIPIVANRRWKSYVNSKLLDKAGIRLPGRMTHTAIKVRDLP